VKNGDNLVVYLMNRGGDDYEVIYSPDGIEHANRD
jgi:hypothetical protein